MFIFSHEIDSRDFKCKKSPGHFLTLSCMQSSEPKSESKREWFTLALLHAGTWFADCLCYLNAYNHVWAGEWKPPGCRWLHSYFNLAGAGVCLTSLPAENIVGNLVSCFFLPSKLNISGFKIEAATFNMTESLKSKAREERYLFLRDSGPWKAHPGLSVSWTSWFKK